MSELQVNAWLKGQRNKGVYFRRSNSHSQSIKSFARWLWKTKKTQAHLLNALSTLNEDVDSELSFQPPERTFFQAASISEYSIKEGLAL